MKEMEAVYVSGPISHPDPEQMQRNLMRGSEIGARLYEQGKAPFIPHANAQHMREYTPMVWKDFMRIDLKLLKRSDSIYLMKGWEGSRGCRIEAFMAKRWNMPIYYEDEGA